jgi:hypothetical protein
MRCNDQSFPYSSTNRQNPKDDHNLLAIPQDVVTTTQLQNYRNLCNMIKHSDVQWTLLESRRPYFTKPCHSAPKIISMTINHHALSHIRLAIFRSTKSTLEARNRILTDPTMLNNNGI